jgi:hypothetical protein
MFPKSSVRWLFVFLAGGLFLNAACSGPSNPAGPSSNGNSSPPPSSTAGLTGSVAVSVNPNPVPFSGKPITDVKACEKRNNTWYYEQSLEEKGGVAVTFHTQQDWFDGFLVNDLTGLKVVVPARGRLSNNVRWCSSTNSKHTAQSTFTGVDANGNAVTVKGPVAQLMAP